MLRRITFSIILLSLLCISCAQPVKITGDKYTPFLSLIAAKKYTEAVKGLEQELKADSRDWWLYHYLGICYEKMGRRSKAVEYYATAIAYADNYRPFYRLGMLYIEMGESDEALRLLRKVKSYNPDFLNGRFYLAIAAFFSNRIEESLENFRYILDREENNPGSLAGIGVIKYYQGNPLQAVEFLLRSIDYAPGWAWGRFQLGTIYLKMGEVNAAYEQFKLALKHDPENITIKYHMALALESKKETERAEKLYDALLALKENDESNEVSIIKASIYIMRGELPEARDLLLSLLGDKTQNFEVYKRLGYIYSMLADHERGIECYREALRAYPDDIGVRYNYAVLLKEVGEEEEAERQLDEILKVNPLSSEGYFIQGIIHGRRGDLEKAEMMIKTAVELDRFNSAGRKVLINILMLNDKLTEAAAIAEEILLINPENSEVKSVLAEILVNIKNYRRAEILLRELINWDDPGIEDIENMKNLHVILKETNRYGEADRVRARLEKLGVSPLKEDMQVVY